MFNLGIFWSLLLRVIYVVYLYLFKFVNFFWKIIGLVGYIFLFMKNLFIVFNVFN